MNSNFLRTNFVRKTRQTEIGNKNNNKLRLGNLRLGNSKTKKIKLLLSTFFKKYLSANTVEHIFCHVTGCSIGVYNFILCYNPQG